MAYIGEIRLFALPRPPRGWMPCDGRLLRTIEPAYVPLFSIIGSKFGGDHQQTFALPTLPHVTPDGPFRYFCVRGTYASEKISGTIDDLPYTGEIRRFALDFEPAGWFACDGRLVAISHYSELFMLIGTRYGGDGKLNFALPDVASDQTTRLSICMTGGRQAYEYDDADSDFLMKFRS